MEAQLTIVSIGPGSPSLMTLETAELLGRARVILRTDHHPVASWLRKKGIPYTSLDDLYESIEDFDELYEQMARRILSELNRGSSDSRPLVYAVPDPCTDRSVDCLFALVPSAMSTIHVLPGVSAADSFLSSARAYLRDSGIRIVPAATLKDSGYDPSQPMLVTELDSAIQAGDVKIFLSDLLEDETPVCFLQGSDREMTSCRQIPFYELDRQPAYNHLSAVLFPAADRDHRSRYTLRDLESIMEILRAPDGCPWDSTQTHASLRPYLVEEAWEAVNAIDTGDMEHLADELGDVLFQVVFHASIGRAYDEFTLTDVITAVCRKMLD